MSDITLSAYVRPELAAIWDTIRADRPDAADRFLDAAQRTFEQLGAMPRMGRTRKFGGSRLRGMRSFLVDGFPNYLVFYQPTPNGIHILHVYHAARDIEAIFDEK